MILPPVLSWHRKHSVEPPKGWTTTSIRLCLGHDSGPQCPGTMRLMGWHDAASLDGLREFRTVSIDKRVCKYQTPAPKEVKARARDLNFVNFAHENRSSHVDAHNLARSLISFVPGRHVWLLTPPEGVCNSYDQLN
jgi:hypothetical protein